MSEAVGKRVLALSRALLEQGESALGPLPGRDELAGRTKEERHPVLDELRVELYALSSLLADATVHRAWEARAAYPPYGLVRSLVTDFRLVTETPTVVGEGDVDGFYTLGKRFVDTMVFHLHRHVSELRETGGTWPLDRLEGLLALFRIGAGPHAAARMRDPVTFVYGGLHFGAGVSVQLAEVMTRVLAGSPGLSAEDKVAVLERSSRPAFTMAALNLDHVVPGFQRLQGPQQLGTRAGMASVVSWMDESKFVLQRRERRPWRFELAEGAMGPLEEIPTTWSTHGCPARISPSGGQSAIATLWSWCVSLVRDTGLLEAFPASTTAR